MEQENNTIQQRQDKNKAEVIEQLKKTPIIELTCKKTSISRATFYRWRKEDPEFAQLVEQSLDEGLATISDLAESKLINAIQNDNMTGIIFWLRAHHSAYRTRVEVTTEKPKDELTPEDNEAVQQALIRGNLTLEANVDNNSQ